MYSSMYIFDNAESHHFHLAGHNLFVAQQRVYCGFLVNDDRRGLRFYVCVPVSSSYASGRDSTGEYLICSIYANLVFLRTVVTENK